MTFKQPPGNDVSFKAGSNKKKADTQTDLDKSSENSQDYAQKPKKILRS